MRWPNMSQFSSINSYYKKLEVKGVAPRMTVRNLILKSLVVCGGAWQLLSNISHLKYAQKLPVLQHGAHFPLQSAGERSIRWITGHLPLGSANSSVYMKRRPHTVFTSDVWLQTRRQLVPVRHTRRKKTKKKQKRLSRWNRAQQKE